MNEGFGHELRRLRTRLGVSLKSLSEMTHYSKGYLSRVETGARAATPELAGRCDDVLGADGSLLKYLTAAESRFGSPGISRPAQLPVVAADFVGRQDAIRRLDGMLPTRGTTVCAIDGMAGVGKTALAVHWAQRVRERFPDGFLFAELAGPGPGQGTRPSAGEVLAGFLRALRPGVVIPATVAERASLFRTLVDGRRMLIVLDDAGSVEQVAPLLPASPGCMVLLTSRIRMTALTSARLLSLETMSRPEAVRLVASTIGEHRTAAEPQATRELTQVCELLPLALRVAAGRLAARPSWLISSLVERLREGEEGMSMLRLGGGTVASAFRPSYDRLNGRAARAFRLIAPLDAALTSVSTAADLLGSSHAHTEDVLEELVDASLLNTPVPGLYSCHPLLRSFARDLVRQGGDGSLDPFTGENESLEAFAGERHEPAPVQAPPH
ncbi:helix-turn-helix domain-containing protein [Kitasatospora sp. NBC_01287]|uniref:helix-turn-helix domain-containing protein n=1 Tax=Kitasatospora sp. NBC_01287 TaxID=2903573 RepID=UPI00225063F0|nr:helix-turn-helix transcriptional regulator [Kitasatospora sp. NBC_01287]MCX4743978.1 helix-turn-helix domain-containing protein [Kitasatospora sp. NBC_01287]